MSAFLKWLGAFLGKLFSEIIPTLLNEGKQPRKARPAGYDKDLKSDMEKEIEIQADKKE